MSQGGRCRAPTLAPERWRLLCVAALLCVPGCDDGAQDGDEPSMRDARVQDEPDPPGSDGPDASVGAGGGGADQGGSGSGNGGRGQPAADAGEAPPPPVGFDAGAECEPVAVGQLPEELSCTGLYADIESKEIASGVREFAPAHQLWSDGAEKQRWIYLPEGTQIDTSAADDWRFPVGTKLFKEFSWNGQRVETRLFWKSGEGRWLKAAYHWNEDETQAERFAGGEVQVGGDTYYIPSAKECDQCHKGRTDRALGFELISLGLPGATGMTLPQLLADGLLTDEPAETALEIGDDGSGQAAPALAWLHVNCGVSCHNNNPAAEGYSSDLRLRLPADGVDGRSSAEFDSVLTTVNVEAQTPRWLGRTLIVPGAPEDSWLYSLASMRNPAVPKDQMPPIASRRVDEDGIMLLGTWIRNIPTTP
jgi:hypothetical protein